MKKPRKPDTRRNRPPMKAESFWKTIEKHENYCWEWQHRSSCRGYGHYARGIETPHGISILPHRAAYMLQVGPIDDGLDIDHLCLNPQCVRPDHLEAVPHFVNMRRQFGGSMDETQCPNGHEMSEANSYRYANRRPSCRQCNRESARRSAAKRRAS